MSKELVDWAPALFAIVLLAIGAFTCFRRQDTTNNETLDTVYCYSGFILGMITVMVAIIVVPAMFNGIRPIP